MNLPYPDTTSFTAAATRNSVFGPIVDRVLCLHRDFRVDWLANVRRGLVVFPEIAGLDRDRLVRRIALSDAFNRTMFRLQTQFPQVAATASRFVPVADPYAALENVPAGRPLILALMHFGPIHFNFTVLKRRFPGRKIYAFHAGGDTAERASGYLRHIGVTPLVSDEKSLRIMAREMAADPKCAVVMGFDYFGSRGRRSVPFLGASVPVTRGLAYLADVRNAVVLPAWGEIVSRRPRVVVDALIEIDRTLEAARRQDDLTEKLFRILEARLRERPWAWSEWHNCSFQGEGSR